MFSPDRYDEALLLAFLAVSGLVLVVVVNLLQALLGWFYV